MTQDIQTTAEAAEAAAMPRARVVHADPQAGPTPEQQPLPAALANTPVEEKSPAEWTYERLILYIQNFEAQLDADHEVAMGFAGGDVGVLRIMGIGFFAPDLITFYGTDDAGTKMQLVQHVHQLNMMLRAVVKAPGEGQANRIGFRLAQDLEKKAAETQMVGEKR